MTSRGIIIEPFAKGCCETTPSYIGGAAHSQDAFGNFPSTNVFGNKCGNDSLPQYNTESVFREKNTEFFEAITQVCEDFSRQCGEFLNKCAKAPDRYDLWKSRGIAPDMVDRFGLGSDCSGYNKKGLTMPLCNGSYTIRNLQLGSKARYFNAPNAKTAPFNMEVLYQEYEDPTPVFIVEGVIDALSIIQVGGRAMATVSTSNVGAVLKILQRCRPNANVILIIAMDPDGAGERAAKDLADGLNKLGIDHYKVNITGTQEDANDLLRRAPRELAERVRECQTNAENRAKECKEEDRKEDRTEKIIEDKQKEQKSKGEDPIVWVPSSLAVSVLCRVIASGKNAKNLPLHFDVDISKCDDDGEPIGFIFHSKRECVHIDLPEAKRGKSIFSMKLLVFLLLKIHAQAIENEEFNSKNRRRMNQEIIRFPIKEIADVGICAESYAKKYAFNEIDYLSNISFGYSFENRLLFERMKFIVDTGRHNGNIVLKLNKDFDWNLFFGFIMPLPKTFFKLNTVAAKLLWEITFISRVTASKWVSKGMHWINILHLYRFLGLPLYSSYKTKNGDTSRYASNERVEIINQIEKGFAEISAAVPELRISYEKGWRGMSQFAEKSLRVEPKGRIKKLFDKYNNCNKGGVEKKSVAA